MTFAPAAELPGLFHHKLARNTNTTEAATGKFINDQEYVNRVVITGQRMWFHNCWFRKGIDPMKAVGSVFSHCKFGDEHAVLLDPLKPDLGFFSWVQTDPQNAYWDGAQWCPDGKFLWCETTGQVIDGYKIGPGMFIEDSYIHDLMRNKTDFYTKRDPGSTDYFTHNDGVQCLQATRQCGVRRSRILQRQDQMSCFMIKPDSADIVDFVIEDNYLDAHNCIFAITGGKGTLKKLTVRGNTFGDGVVWALVDKYLDTNKTQVIWENNKLANGKPLSLADARKNPIPR